MSTATAREVVMEFMAVCDPGSQADITRDGKQYRGVLSVVLICRANALPPGESDADDELRLQVKLRGASVLEKGTWHSAAGDMVMPIVGATRPSRNTLTIGDGSITITTMR
ncbi:MAG: hypothetical protein AAB839_00475 [Patescibacteria group bacterium]